MPESLFIPLLAIFDEDRTALRADAGELGQFEEIVAAQNARLLRVAYRLLGNWPDAEDVTQEAFLRLHRQNWRLMPASFRQAWLIRVTTNLCLDLLRKPRGVALEDASALSDPHRLPDAIAADREQLQQLHAALQHLPPAQRAAVILRQIEGMPTPEVAAILGVTEATVRSQVSQAIARLKVFMGASQ